MITAGTASYVRAATLSVTNVQAAAQTVRLLLTISLPTGTVAAPHLNNSMDIGRVELSSGAGGDPMINTLDGESYRL